MTPACSTDEVLDAALALAATTHWERLRLADVAERLGVGLADIHRHFGDKEALVDALWDRADEAMLKARLSDALDDSARIEALMFAWLDALAPYRKTVREMLLVRLEPGHLHIQLPTLVKISRSVQWMREAAGRDAAFHRRALEESGLTVLFVTTAVRWLRDDDEARVRTGLRRALQLAHRVRQQFDPH